VSDLTSNAESSQQDGGLRMRRIEYQWVEAAEDLASRFQTGDMR
jgi:hypothetical protein